MNTTPHRSQAHTDAADQTELLGLQRAGAFLSQRQQRQQHAHSPPMAIPPPRNPGAATHAAYDLPDESAQMRAPIAAQQDSTASSSFLAAIRRGLHDNSPSWNNNGWFIGDDSDEDDDDDDDFYTSMMYPYAGGADTTAYAGGCAPAGSFARCAKTQGSTPELLDFDLTSAASGTIQREGSLIFAMEV